VAKPTGFRQGRVFTSTPLYSGHKVKAAPTLAGHASKEKHRPGALEAADNKRRGLLCDIFILLLAARLRTYTKPGARVLREATIPTSSVTTVQATRLLDTGILAFSNAPELRLISPVAFRPQKGWPGLMLRD
jgi:hypothetical protein